MTRVRTISLSREADEALERLATERYGRKKGAISKVISVALLNEAAESDQERLKKRALARLKRGWDMGGILYKSRDELYDR